MTNYPPYRPVDLSVTTTNGETFTTKDTQTLAGLVFKRFGRDSESATLAWNRLLQNNCTKEVFLSMVPHDVLYPIR